MPPLQIRSPIWASRSVGIAEHKIGLQGIDLEIIYKDKLGNRVYPFIYHINREKIIKYPIKVINDTIKLRIVPIADLEIKQNDM